AWTWEHMALTRARVIAGPPALAAKVAASVDAVLALQRDPAKLRTDVAEMRQRIAREHAARGAWDLKYVSGGLIDIEFIAQYLALAHPAAVPDMLRENTGAAIEVLATKRRLAAADDKALVAAWRLQTALQAVLRLSLEGDFDPAAAPPGLAAALARA